MFPRFDRFATVLFMVMFRMVIVTTAVLSFLGFFYCVVGLVRSVVL